MTPHDHTRFVPGCYRCELGRDEAMDALSERAEEAEAEVERLRDELLIAKWDVSTLQTERDAAILSATMALRLAARDLLDALERHDNFPVSAVNAMERLRETLATQQKRNGEEAA